MLNPVQNESAQKSVEKIEKMSNYNILRNDDTVVGGCAQHICKLGVPAMYPYLSELYGKGH